VEKVPVQIRGKGKKESNLTSRPIWDLLNFVREYEPERNYSCYFGLNENLCSSASKTYHQILKERQRVMYESLKAVKLDGGMLLMFVEVDINNNVLKFNKLVRSYVFYV